MPSEIIDLLNIKRGSITAPAGCGKTQLIVTALKAHSQAKPILILTHTNAGVSALRMRLKKNGVPESKYKLVTIDGWVLQLVSSFPKRSGINLESIKLLNPSKDYLAIRTAAIKILNEHHIDNIIKSNYSQLIVDEYQDCSIVQHSIIVHLSQLIPACVLGDPLQAIFGFKGNALVDWQKDVQSYFSPCGELGTPWRWKNAGAESFGNWLLEIRKDLLENKEVDFSSAPPEVNLIRLNNVSDHEKILEAANVKVSDKNDSILIIGDSINAKSRHQIASSIYGAVTVEPVDFKDLISFSDSYFASSAFFQILELVKELMTGISSLNLEKRIPTIQAGRERNPPTVLENQILDFIKNPEHKNAINLLKDFTNQKDVRVYRPAIYYACIKGFQIAADNPDITLKEAMIRIREQNRAVGRIIPKRAVGSTLLLKGLEAEYAVILKADTLDSRNLYVAMTRGSKGLIVCSSKYNLKSN